MKANKALINIYSNIQCVEKNHSGLEAVYLSEKYNMDLIGKAGRTNKHFDKFVDIFSVKDLSDYDKVMIQLSQPNFFGGVIGEDTIEKVNKLAAFTGNIAILCTDPRIKPTNPAEVINSRLEDTFSKDIIERWEYILRDATYLFPGKDLAKFWNDNKYNNVEVRTFNFFPKIFGKLLNPQVDELRPKTHDVVYYGDRRGSHREKLVEKYMPQSESSLLIGFKTNKVDVPFIKKLKHSELMDKLDQCKVSLVLGDAEHEDNVVTFRLYETLASNCLAAIPIQYDRKMEIIKDPELRKILYVKDKQDVRNLVDKYSVELIKKQHEEFRRLTS